MRKIFFVPVIIISMLSCNRKADFQVSSLVSRDSTDICEIEVNLPVISEKSGNYHELCDKVNGDIKNFTNSTLLNFKKDAFSFYDEFVKNQPNKPVAGYQFYSDYDKFYADNKVLSVRYINYFYEAGAHGRTVHYCFNYDVQADKKLNFSDVFRIDNQSMNKINKLLLDNFKNPEGCFTQEPKIDSEYKLFNVQKDSVVFTFEHYELGAYACGVAEIKIPKVKLIEDGLYKR